MSAFSMMIFSVWLGCRTVSEDSAVEIDRRPDDDGVIAEPSTENELRDIDQDGFLEDVDCDDWNPNIHPDAEEILNNKDDDCDGFVDADGRHGGRLQFEAVAIYQGEPYAFTQVCDADILRVRGQVEMLLTCVIDQTQERADQLLGETLTVTANENFVFEDNGDTSAVFVSVGGETEWDATGVTNWTWSSWEDNQSNTLDVQVRLDALHLDIWINGTLQRMAE